MNEIPFLLTWKKITKYVMKKNKSGIRMITSAVIWAAVLIACTMVLKGTPYKEKINYILTIGILFHLMFIWAPIGKDLRAKNKGII